MSRSKDQPEEILDDLESIRDFLDEEAAAVADENTRAALENHGAAVLEAIGTGQILLDAETD